MTYMSKRIYLCLAHMSGKEQDFIREAFETNWVAPLGPNVNGFEEDLKRFVEKMPDQVGHDVSGFQSTHRLSVSYGLSGRTERGSGDKDADPHGENCLSAPISRRQPR